MSFSNKNITDIDIDVKFLPEEKSKTADSRLMQTEDYSQAARKRE